MVFASAFLSLSPILGLFFMALLLAIAFTIKHPKLLVKIQRVTRWSWPIYFLPVSGGTTPVGPNTEIDGSARIAALEAVNFQGGISTNPALNTAGLALTMAKYTASGAVALPSKSGLAVVSGATVLAMTLATPTAGLPSVGGDDGKLLVIINDTAAKAQVITLPANALQGTLHIITMSATASTFSAITLIAFNGSWWVLSNSNCALT